MRKELCIALAGVAVASFAISGSADAQLAPGRQGLVRPKLSVYSGPKNEIYSGQILIKFKARPVEANFQSTKAKVTREAISADEVTRIEKKLSGGAMLKSLKRGGWTVWKIPTVLSPRAAAERLMDDPSVLSASPVNKIYPLIPTPNDGDWDVIETGPPMIFDFGDAGDAQFRRLWHIDETDSFNAWANYPNKWYTSFDKPRNAPLIAIIDTGCDMDHPDFINAGGNSSDSADGGQIVKSLSRQFSDGEVLEGGDPTDSNGHGTHVSGLAVAAGNNGSFNGQGTIGIGYNSRAMILRVFDDQGAGSDMDAAMAIFYAADNGADIINLSLGTTNYSQIFQDAVTYAWQKGTLVVAAGNEAGSGGGNLGPIYPAACSGALAVTANGPQWIPANDNYAGYGSYVDIAAPGGNLVTYSQIQFALQYVYSTACTYPCALSENTSLVPAYTNEYSYLIGTSMACPQVSGAAGLYYGKYNLKQSDGYSNFRAYRAIERAAQGTNFVRNGGWELTQGFGSLDSEALLREQDSRLAKVGSIEGMVYYGGTPTPNVRVTATIAGRPKPYQTTTQRDGTYRFDGIPAGVYAVKAVPFGSAKTKSAQVIPGSDQTGTDFYCGPAVIDETAPTIAKFGIVSATSKSITLDQWGYDTETGIDRIDIKIGTTPGSNDILAGREILPGSTRVVVSDLSLPANYSVTITYTNGEGLKSYATQDNIAAGDDSYVRDTSHAAVNFGSANELLIKKWPGGLNRWTYLSFPIASVGATSSAKLRFQGKSAWYGQPVGIRAWSAASTTWGQNTITWNNKPALGTIEGSATTILNGVEATYELDVTNIVKAAKLAGKSTVTVILVGTGNTEDAASIASKETGKPARLIVQNTK